MAINGGKGAVGGAASVSGAVGDVGAVGDDSDSNSSSTLLSLSQSSSADVVSSSSSDSELEGTSDPIRTLERRIVNYCRSAVGDILHAEGIRARHAVESGSATKEDILSPENKSRLYDMFICSVISEYSSAREMLGDELLSNSDIMGAVTSKVSQDAFSIFESRFSIFAETNLDRYLGSSSPIARSLTDLDTALRGLFNK
ncbi:hypothetical protein [Candidatus Ichthyocystis sparus]|uniref:hypothetical protein n=1 Tax=Candidatus Ichthyocystis sparus TaxID=1561004 RepID=UPI000B846998|nr:hypothetical protein [Candidatus Ichthyocystis sparus]